MSEPRQIKKYPNRRLYDTELSRYITLADVCKLVNDQGDIRVIEQRTGRDITRTVLLQVIAEQEQGQAVRLSEAFLCQLIRSYSAVPASSVSTALENALGAVLAGAPP